MVASSLAVKIFVWAQREHHTDLSGWWQIEQSLNAGSPSRIRAHWRTLPQKYCLPVCHVEHFRDVAINRQRVFISHVPLPNGITIISPCFFFRVQKRRERVAFFSDSLFLSYHHRLPNDEKDAISSQCSY